MMTRDSKINYNVLIRRLQRTRRSEKQTKLVAGILLATAFSSASIFIFLTLDWLLQFDRTSRIVIDISLGIIIILLISYYIGIPFFRLLFRTNHPSLDTIAARIGIQFPKIRDRLINAMQIYRYHLNNSERYAMDLVHEALNNAHQDCRTLDFNSIIDSKPVRKGVQYIVLALVLILPVMYSYRTTYEQSILRLLQPRREFQFSTPFTFEILPGNIDILKGESVDFEITATGKVPSEIQLHIQNAITGYETVQELTNRRKKFLYTLDNVKDSTRYFISVASYVSPTHAIQVIELPMVRHLQVRLSYPAYSNIEKRFLDENVGDITALKGTKAYVRLEANKRLDNAAIVLKNAKPMPLTVRGSTAEGQFEIMKDDTYYIGLLDLTARQNQNPIEYRIQLLEDNSPLVRITQPGEDVDISEEMLLPLVIEAEDDFGFSKLQLYYRLMKSAFSTDTTWHSMALSIPDKNVQKITIPYNWDLSNLNMFPEDIIAYYVEVKDNDSISGPKAAKSLIYHVRFPSINEMYDDVERDHDMAFQNFEGMYEQSKEVKEKLSELVQDMKKNPNLNWEEKKKLEDVVNTQEEMQKALEDVEQQLDEMIERMEKNDLTTVETLKKYMELQNLMQEMMNEDLKKAIDQLQKAMENVDPDELKKAVENMDVSQEDFLKNIEKTLSLLKRLHAEQQLDELTKRVESMLEQQHDINEQASNANENLKDQLSGEQQKLEQDSKSLKQQLDKLQKTMSEFEDMPNTEIQETQNIMQEQQLQSNMNQAKQQFQQGNFQQGKQLGQKSQQTLSSMMQSLQQAKQRMLSQQKQQALAEMRRMNHDLLQLSKSQEEVMKQGKGMGRNSPRLEELANRQQDLLNGLQRVINRAGSLENKSFFISPQIAQAIGKSLNAMQASIKNIEARSMTRATRGQGQAMASLNDAVKQIRQSMQQMSSMQSGSPLQQMMQQLSQMSQQQQGINQQTMQLGMGQSMSLQQQAAMARLAAQQAALKKTMEQLAKEFANRNELLGNLDQIAKDMDDVAKDLKKQQVTRQTHNRQRRILSRLLDAQKSMQRREYSRKRKADSGKFYLATNPGALPGNLGERDLIFRQDILKATREGYTKDYQELIKKYFEALLNEAANK